MTIIDLPKAVMRSTDDCPMVDAGEGVKLQLLQVDVEVGLWVIRNLFEPGARVQTHKHTGQVFAFTQQGCWKYDEYPELMTAGTYLFEPAGSIHTLIVPETNTEVTDVWFAIYGANLNLDADGNVESVLDAGFIRDAYFALCEAEGFDRPNVIGA
jgi:quercetin dioxygenase-like cupin family protein